MDSVTYEIREIRPEEYPLLDDERCYLGEELNDILTARPSYAGKIGYICEYDS